MFTTFTGKNVSLALKPKDVCIKDIAHSLALQCRYNGHCSDFYSVAEHSVRCAAKAMEFELDPRYLLLHDAAEAYCGDIITDIKPEVFDEKVESKIRRAIFNHYDLRESYWDDNYSTIKLLDSRMLITECRDLMPVAINHILDFYLPLFEEKICPKKWEDAEADFLFAAKLLGLGD